jgi:hypothetical protein
LQKKGRKKAGCPAAAGLFLGKKQQRTVGLCALNRNFKVQKTFATCP